jgi:hypothetical protein
VPTAAATGFWATGAGITLIDRRVADAHPDLFAPRTKHARYRHWQPAGDLTIARVSGYEIDGKLQRCTDRMLSRPASRPETVECTVVGCLVA